MPASVALPQLGSALFLTDGGLETTLIERDGIELPDFAAFPLVQSSSGLAALEAYFLSYITLAQRHGLGIVLETPTWRASTDWGRRLGYSSAALRTANMAAVIHLLALREAHGEGETPIVVSGNLGPRSDGYSPTSVMTAAESQAYHSEQIRALADAGADLVTALTIAHVDEAIGIVRAAVEHEIEVVISFTVDAAGRLPSGQLLEQAIVSLDEATRSAAAYVMVNCAHPLQIMQSITPNPQAFSRLRGVRANAALPSDGDGDGTSPESSDPADFALRYRELAAALPALTIMGGCCGTDERHIEAIATACVPLFTA